ncbi:MAG: hypothetical protein HOW73_41050 [Polyangiaceae bacterium]|nr:hypothetical protein [Polyangiaceae bacterium]
MPQLRANCRLTSDRLGVDYEVFNDTAEPIYVRNRYGGPVPIHPNSTRRESYTTSSAAIYRLSSGEILLFQGRTILAGPPFPYAPPPQPASTEVGPGQTTSGILELSLPLRASHGTSSTFRAPAEGYAPTGRAILVVEVLLPPLTNPPQQQDGTDAVYVSDDNLERLSVSLELPNPVMMDVSQALTRWGDEHWRIIREKKSAFEGRCSFEPA